jgi:hypothetical protein
MSATVNSRESAPQQPRTPAQGKVDPTVDPRIAKTGGRRCRFGDPKSPYTWPGMDDERSWRRTDVHKHSTYHCLWCGLTLATPNAIYTHIDKVHPR